MIDFRDFLTNCDLFYITFDNFRPLALISLVNISPNFDTSLLPQLKMVKYRSKKSGNTMVKSSEDWSTIDQQWSNSI